MNKPSGRKSLITIHNKPLYDYGKVYFLGL